MFRVIILIPQQGAIGRNAHFSIIVDRKDMK